MPILMPTISLKRVTDISIDLLRSLDARAIFLDVDNTLALHGSQEPFPGQWSGRIECAKPGLKS